MDPYFSSPKFKRLVVAERSLQRLAQRSPRDYASSVCVPASKAALRDGVLF